jgi:hypothetical protein
MNAYTIVGQFDYYFRNHIKSVRNVLTIVFRNTVKKRIQNDTFLLLISNVRNILLTIYILYTYILRINEFKKHFFQLRKRSEQLHAMMNIIFSIILLTTVQFKHNNSTYHLVLSITNTYMHVVHPCG